MSAAAQPRLADEVLDALNDLSLRVARMGYAVGEACRDERHTEARQSCDDILDATFGEVEEMRAVGDVLAIWEMIRTERYADYVLHWVAPRVSNAAEAHPYRLQRVEDGLAASTVPAVRHAGAAIPATLRLYAAELERARGLR